MTSTEHTSACRVMFGASTWKDVSRWFWREGAPLPEADSSLSRQIHGLWINSQELVGPRVVAMGSLTVICYGAVWFSVQCFHPSWISRLEGRCYLNWVELEEILTVIVTLSFFLKQYCWRKVLFIRLVLTF